MQDDRVGFISQQPYVVLLYLMNVVLEIEKKKLGFMCKKPRHSLTLIPSFSFLCFSCPLSSFLFLLFNSHFPSLPSFLPFFPDYLPFPFPPSFPPSFSLPTFLLSFISSLFLSIPSFLPCFFPSFLLLSFYILLLPIKERQTFVQQVHFWTERNKESHEKEEGSMIQCRVWGWRLANRAH